MSSWLTRSLRTRPCFAHRRGPGAEEKTLTEAKIDAEQNPKGGSAVTSGERVLAAMIVLVVLALLIYVWIREVAKLL